MPKTVKKEYIFSGGTQIFARGDWLVYDHTGITIIADCDEDIKRGYILTKPRDKFVKYLISEIERLDNLLSGEAHG